MGAVGFEPTTTGLSAPALEWVCDLLYHLSYAPVSDHWNETVFRRPLTKPSNRAPLSHGSPEEGRPVAGHR